MEHTRISKVSFRGYMDWSWNYTLLQNYLWKSTERVNEVEMAFLDFFTEKFSVTIEKLIFRIFDPKILKFLHLNHICL